MPRHSLEEGFLAAFVAHLQTLAGGKKSGTVATEIGIDVAKYLYFANPELSDPENLLTRNRLTGFVTTLEQMGVGSSGIRTKMTRLRQAMQFFELTCEGREDEAAVSRRAEHAKQLLEGLRGCVAQERAREERQRLNLFQPPPLDDVGSFLSSSRLSAQITLLGGRLQARGHATTAELEEAQLIIAGRVMYRYVKQTHMYTDARTTCTQNCLSID